MADGVVSTKFVANGTDGERAIAALEKKYAELASKISETNSKAKAEAIAARMTTQAQAKEVAEAARKQRDIERALAASQREERKRTERDSRELLRKMERDASESKRNQARVERDAERAKLAEEREAARNKLALEREAAREQKQLEAASRREALATSRERVRAKREEVRDKKRLIAEEAREERRIEAESKRKADQTAAWVQTIIQAGVAYLGVSSIIDTIITQNQKLIEQADEQSLKQDLMTRKFRVQGELNKLKGDEAAASINKIAIKNAVSSEQAFSGAEALASHGFSAKDAQGPALDILLQGMAANNMMGEDPAQLAGAIAMKLDVFKKTKNVENLTASIKATQRLSKPTNTRVTDSIATVAKMSGVADSVDEKTADSILAIVHQTANNDVTGTAVKLFFDRLKAPTKAATKEFAKMKMVGDDGKLRPIMPADVDMIGEDAPTAIRRMGAGLASLPENQRPVALNKIFGAEAASPAKFLMDRVDQIEKFNKLQEDVAGFDEDVKINTSGPAAARRRFNVQRELQFAKRGDDGTLLLDVLESKRRESGRAEWLIGLERKNAELIRYLGGSIEYAASKLTPFGPEGERIFVEGLQDVQALKGGEMPVGIAERSVKLLEEQNKLIERQNQLLEAADARQNKAEPAKRAKPVNADE